MTTWKIAPLKGKYYGTIVEGPGLMEIKIWGHRIWQPSERQIKDWWPHEAPSDEDVRELMSDGHYEDVGDFEIARVIVDALNAAKLPVEPK